MRRLLIVVAILLLATAALAQIAPTEFWGVVYNAVFPTLTNGQSTTWQATANGRTNVTGINLVVCTGGGTINLTLGCTLGRGAIP